MKIIDNTLLTEREEKIILFMLEGKTKQEIAEQLCLSVATIKTSTEKMYAKFDVHNKIEMLFYLVKNKIVELD